MKTQKNLNDPRRSLLDQNDKKTVCKKSRETVPLRNDTPIFYLSFY